jgi:UDP-3-O-[3-hydroxymyristoyl] glucosamine N-acyltransferase
MVRLSKIASLLEGTLHGDDIDVSGISIAESQQEGTISILGSPKFHKLADGAASAYVVSMEGVDTKGKPYIMVKNHRLAIVTLLNLFMPEKLPMPTISPKSSISDKAVVEVGVSIGDFAVIGEARIGEGTRIYPGVVVGDNVTIGENCILYPNVVIYDNSLIGNNVILHAGVSIGGDGFGFVPGQLHTKIPHKGNVILRDHVEIGANSTVDRGTIGSTVIGEGTKLDNLVQVAHNVQIGRGCFIAGLVGISGSTKVGDYVTMGGQVGLADHITVGSFVSLAAKTGVHQDLEDNMRYGGIPALPDKEWARQIANIKNLSDTRKRLIALEKIVAEMKSDE